VRSIKTQGDDGIEIQKWGEQVSFLLAGNTSGKPIKKDRCARASKKKRAALPGGHRPSLVVPLKRKRGFPRQVGEKGEV